MRSTADRIRHMLMFEGIALILVIPVGAIVMGTGLHDMGVVAIVCSLVAMAWVYAYNLIFDRAMLRIAGHTRKSLRLRILHTLLFEAGLVAMLLPFIAWYLGITLVEAFLLDLGITIFYLFYTFGFNWAYDRVFPVPEGA